MFRRTSRLIPLVLALAGCAPGNSGLIVGNVIAPDDQKVYAVGNDALTSGVLDVNAYFDGYLNAGYQMHVRMLNQLVDLGNNGTSGVPMANPNLISVQQAEVELQDVGGAPLALGLPNPFTVPAGGVVVPSSDGTTPGEAIAAFEVIPLVYRDALLGSGGTTVVASVQAIGQTAGGAEVVAPPFTFPIQICDGCLLRCSVNDDGTPVCQESLTPGQDYVQYDCGGVPDGMGGMFAYCQF